MSNGPDVASDYVHTTGGQSYTLQATYANGLTIDSKIARVVPGSPETFTYYVGDALGSVHASIDLIGNIIPGSQTLSTAWGEDLPGFTSATIDRYGYTQREKEYDPATGEADGSGLMHYRARSYDPRIGRFMQKDPKDSLVGQYGYASNNPVEYIDPLGLNAGRSRVTDVLPDLPPQDRPAPKFAGKLAHNGSDYPNGSMKFLYELEGPPGALMIQRVTLKVMRDIGGFGLFVPIFTLSYAEAWQFGESGVIRYDWHWLSTGSLFNTKVGTKMNVGDEFYIGFKFEAFTEKVEVNQQLPRWRNRDAEDPDDMGEVGDEFGFDYLVGGRAQVKGEEMEDASRYWNYNTANGSNGGYQGNATISVIHEMLGKIKKNANNEWETEFTRPPDEENYKDGVVKSRVWGK